MIKSTFIEAICHAENFCHSDHLQLAYAPSLAGLSSPAKTDAQTLHAEIGFSF
jgi:hypothetical protein